ncbi:hypothetical protein GUJ93_ZPchr0012g20768 [Zizania palustris]|uniref:Uncharacterized protein n=1 Tax=Zizania palustris TaxID=103762 RepID=A0A8J5WVE2_ZIZPA|nr:hypothetical protein GUJ93_ZPchr0012g20768 [Zizania palustris]
MFSGSAHRRTAIARCGAEAARKRCGSARERCGSARETLARARQRVRKGVARGKLLASCDACAKYMQRGVVDREEQNRVPSRQPSLQSSSSPAPVAAASLAGPRCGRLPRRPPLRPSPKPAPAAAASLVGPRCSRRPSQPPLLPSPSSAPDRSHC